MGYPAVWFRGCRAVDIGGPPRPPNVALSLGGLWRKTGVMSVVMLTGASGFLGIHILGRLLDEGYRVRALVRTPAKLRENLALLDLDPDDPRIEVCPGI